MAYRNFQFVRANATADGDNTVLAAVGANSKIVVLGYALTASAAGTIIFQDSANVAVASFTLPINGGISYAGSEACPAFELPAGTGLEISNGAGVDTNGHLTYIVVPA